MPGQLIDAPVTTDSRPLGRDRTRRPTGSAARRRQVFAALATATVLTGALSVVLSSLKWVAAAAAVLTIGYVAAIARARHLAVQREMARAFGAPGGGFDWAALAEPGETPMTAEEKLVAVTGGGPLTVVRFAFAYLLGWVLTPVAVAIHLLAGDRRDLEGEGVLARIVALQRRGRAHSFRALAVSLATTAGVTAVGGLTGMVAAPAASAAPAPGTYTVQPGDTLATIAAAHATTIEAMVAANHLADPNLIFPGQVLVVGGGASVTSGALAGAGSGSYTVQAGDTLGSIAGRFGTTWEALAAANHLADPNVIFTGDVLSVDGSAVGTVAASPAVPSPAAPPSAAPPAASSLGAGALSVALQQLGKPYQWAGAGPNSFDCSGLVMYAYEAVGVSLAHYTVTQQAETARITESQLEPGDLVFYGGAAPSHVAMYDGNGNVVTADTTGTPVRVEPITWDGTPTAFGRVG